MPEELSFGEKVLNVDEMIFVNDMRHVFELAQTRASTLLHMFTLEGLMGMRILDVGCGGVKEVEDGIVIQSYAPVTLGLLSLHGITKESLHGMDMLAQNPRYSDIYTHHVGDVTEPTLPTQEQFHIICSSNLVGANKDKGIPFGFEEENFVTTMAPYCLPGGFIFNFTATTDRTTIGIYSVYYNDPERGMTWLTEEDFHRLFPHFNYGDLPYARNLKDYIAAIPRK